MKTTTLLVSLLLLFALAAPAAADPKRTPVPEALVGDWMHGTISPTDFFDSATGRHLGNAYGVGVYFSFTADGSFKQYVYVYSTAYSCRTETWTALEGTVAFEGESFRLYPAQGKYRVSNNCAKSQNYTRPMSEKELSDAQGKLHSFRWTGDDAWPLEVGVGDAGGRSSFRRAGN